jgi:hypothetical protein
MFEKDTVDFVAKVTTPVLFVATYLGGMPRYLAVVWFVPCLALYYFLSRFGARLDERLYASSNVSLLSIRDETSNAEQASSRRYRQTILLCGMVFMACLVWIVTGTVLQTVPAARVRLVQLVAHFAAPQLTIIDTNATSQASSDPAPVVPVESLVNPFEAVREAAMQARMQRDEAIVERDRLRRQLANLATAQADQAPAAAPTPANQPLPVATFQPQAQPAPALVRPVLPVAAANPCLTDRTSSNLNALIETLNEGFRVRQEFLESRGETASERNLVNFGGSRIKSKIENFVGMACVHAF